MKIVQIDVNEQIVDCIILEQKVPHYLLDGFGVPFGPIKYDGIIAY